MSPFYIKAIQLFLSLSLLIVLHELGHFIPAKLFKTRVEKFFLFFDVKFALFKKKIGGTEYGIGWLPLGGYVKISGMIDESMDKEQMAKPPEPWEFRSKPAWQRLIIMLGGVTVNVVLGFLIYMMVLFVWGSNYVGVDDMPDGFAVNENIKQYGFQDGDRVLEVNGEEFEDMMAINKELFVRDVNSITVLHQDDTKQTITVPEDLSLQLFKKGVMSPFNPIGTKTIDSVFPDSPAKKAGLLKGDELVSLDGKNVKSLTDFNKFKEENENGLLQVVVERNGAEKHIEATPDDEGMLGFAMKRNFSIQNKKHSIGESITTGFSYTYWQLHDYAAQFKYVFTKKGATQVGGFGAIGGLFPDVWNWQGFWTTTAFLSIILAFMNILPIPALDGGHVMFLLYEIISGRKPNEKFMEYAQMVGFFILIALVLFANGNDIYRAIFD